MAGSGSSEFEPKNRGFANKVKDLAQLIKNLLKENFPINEALSTHSESCASAINMCIASDVAKGKVCVL
jgi:hypothetical protein